MNDYHDPIRQISYLQQSLSQDKKPLGLFLGAGCPLSIKSAKDEPLIPDIAGITKIVCEHLKSSECFQKVLDHFKQDERAEQNVEDILSHIRALKTVAGKDAVRGLSVMSPNCCENLSPIIVRIRQV